MGNLTKLQCGKIEIEVREIIAELNVPCPFFAKRMKPPIHNVSGN